MHGVFPKAAALLCLILLVLHSCNAKRIHAHTAKHTRKRKAQISTQPDVSKQALHDRLANTYIPRDPALGPIRLRASFPTFELPLLRDVCLWLSDKRKSVYLDEGPNATLMALSRHSVRQGACTECSWLVGLDAGVAMCIQIGIGGGRPSLKRESVLYKGDCNIFERAEFSLRRISGPLRTLDPEQQRRSGSSELQLDPSSLLSILARSQRQQKMERVVHHYEAAKLHLQRPINEILPPHLLLYLVPPLPPLRFVVAALVLVLLLVLRVWWILPARTSREIPSRKPSKIEVSCTVAVFLGSGGHTTELLQLVSALPTDRYTRRIYLVSSGDHFSLEKAKELESKLTATPNRNGSRATAKVIQIPRARKVHQSFLTTPLTLARSIAFCVDHVALRPLSSRFSTPSSSQQRKGLLADVILMNGPGTCVPIVASVYLLRVSLAARPTFLFVGRPSC